MYRKPSSDLLSLYMECIERFRDGNELLIDMKIDSLGGSLNFLRMTKIRSWKVYCLGTKNLDWGSLKELDEELNGTIIAGILSGCSNSILFV